ncbi:MAG: T9SS type A sorting domain-containing protein [Bacteroidetes bacterium]|jgi:hypothetical protein|nr:T9SS type A sorting domain-containing protein [Bacteroidota bacterium]
MKKRIYLLFVFSVITQLAIGQFVINKSFDINGPNVSDVAYSILADSSGFTLDISTFCYDGQLSCGGMLRTNLEGDSLWSSIWDAFPAAFFTTNYIRANDGSYYLSGSEYIAQDSSFSPYLSKVSSQGERTWIEYYNDIEKDVAVDLAIAPDGHLISYNLGGVSGEYSIITVQKLHREDGSVIWEEEVETGLFFPSAGELTVLQDSSIMLAYHYPAPDNHRGYAVSKLSPQGETLWTRRFSEGHTDDYTAFIEALPDGGVAVAWGKDSLNIPQQFKAINFFLQRLDEEGQTEWEFFHRISKRKVYGMTVTENGDIVLCGWTRSPVLGGPSYSWLARFSPEGEMRWERSYLSPGSPQPAWGFQDVTEAPDGGLAMCGFITDTVPGSPGAINDNVWLAKVGPDGCLTPGCQDSIIYITSTREAAGGPAQIKEVFFRAFPNPASGPLQVQFYNPVRYRSARLRVFNMQGQQLWQAPLQKGTQELEIPAGQWASGLYLLQYEVGGRVLQVEKVVRE